MLHKNQPEELRNFKTTQLEQIEMPNGSIEYEVQDVLNHKSEVEDTTD